MGKSALEFKGIKQLEKRLVEGVTFNDVQEVVKRNGAELQHNMQRRAPVDTGFLRRSIGITMTNSGFSVEIGPTADYASYVEYGTRFMSAQPYVRPTFLTQKVTFLNDLKRLVK